MRNPVDQLAEITDHRVVTLVLAFYKANWYYQEGIPFFHGEKMRCAERDMDAAIAAFTGKKLPFTVITSADDIRNLHGGA